MSELKGRKNKKIGGMTMKGKVSARDPEKYDWDRTNK